MAYHGRVIFPGNGPDEFESRIRVERLGLRGEDGADAEVVGPVENRLASLLDRVGRDADQPGFGADDPSHARTSSSCWPT
ncbi:MAG: hypothetical protein Ct9H300mP1_11880 [Planctomycetaceae bacterium]|nr:MAG: hypothetical protein Ct9H300mP1_11880 [Planctomycetaceae bacterium]